VGNAWGFVRTGDLNQGVTAFPALIFERICPTGISDRRDELLEACDFSLQRKWFPRFLDS